MQSVLVVDDDISLQNYLKELLSENNYSVSTAADGTVALNMINKSKPDIVILDLGLPTIKGESVCIEIKKKYPDLPVIILTGTGKTNDLVNMLNLGADDYISKPFIAEEFLARIKARLKHTQAPDGEITIDNLVLNNKTYEVKRGDKNIILTPKEFKLLEYLMINKNQVLTREMILNRVWAFSANIETRIVDVCISSLRKKIDSGFKIKLIQSARGFGYTIKDPEVK
jgi:DNA-binding response OmpR family regulator